MYKNSILIINLSKDINNIILKYLTLTLQDIRIYLNNIQSEIIHYNKLLSHLHNRYSLHPNTDKSSLLYKWRTNFISDMDLQTFSKMRKFYNTKLNLLVQNGKELENEFYILLDLN